jgi:hypothetical protein
MKKCFWTLALVTTVMFTTAAQERIEWSANKRLTVNDFKGTPPDPSTKQSLVARSAIESKFNKDEIKNLKSFNNQISNYFYPNESWVLWTEQSRLRYFQTCFDIDEWMARTLRKRCNDNRVIVLNGEYEKIYKAVETEFKVIKEQYNSETDYGDNPVGQMNWERKISDQLLWYSDYCKTCEPTTKK